MSTQDGKPVVRTDDPVLGNDLVNSPAPAPGVNRRNFLGGLGKGTLALTAASVLGPAILGGKAAPSAEAGTGAKPLPKGGAGSCELGPLSPNGRARKSYSIRVNAAKVQQSAGLINQVCNGDEQLYSTPGVNYKLNSYTKGFAHDPVTGLLANPNDWTRFTGALSAGTQSAIESLPLTAVGSPLQRKQVNPLGGLGFDLEGRDSHATTISNPETVGSINGNPDPDFDQQVVFPAAPTFASTESAGEMIEVYWQALLRDVPFMDYATHPLAIKAAEELTALGADFKGPKDAFGVVTPGQHLFRDRVVGSTVGPYMSQFWLNDQPFGAQVVRGQVRSYTQGKDFMTTRSEWLRVQDGIVPSEAQQFDDTLRWMHSGRDLSAWVHIDVLFQGYFEACLLLLHPQGGLVDGGGGGMGCPLNPGNPYNNSLTQGGFGTFGGPYFKALMCEVATRALKTVWFTKWFVTRRARPEAYAGRLHYALIEGQTGYSTDINPVLLDSYNTAGCALNRVAATTGGNLFLPMAFPEGSPMHPSYGAGHATVAGACVTILKYIFDETYVIPNPKIPNADGTDVLPWTGEPLTVLGELNKIASNVGTGRNIAGVHWRTDSLNSMLLGEQVAVNLLRDQKSTFAEDVGSISFTGLLGNKITI